MQESSYLHQTGHVKNIKEGEEYKSFFKEHLQPKIEREKKAKELLLEYRGKYTEEILKEVFDTFDPNALPPILFSILSATYKTSITLIPFKPRGLQYQCCGPFLLKTL